MTQYLALPQATCTWLLTQPALLTCLFQTIIQAEDDAFSKAEFSGGPLRIAGTSDGNLVAVWNRDYLTGTGVESWGIIRLSGPYGLLQGDEITLQVFERQIYVVSQRLQGLIVEGEYIHRTWPNGSHTCLAGRGTEARQKSICYFEGTPGFADLSARAVMIIGPTHNFDELQISIELEMPLIGKLASAANELLDAKRRPLLDSPSYQRLRDALIPARQEDLKFDSVDLSLEYGSAGSGLAAYETAHWGYEEWLAKGLLNEAQRRVLQSDVLLRHPVRVVGPAGSGKTLLMQLLALRHLQVAQSKGLPLKVIYIVHNAAMATMVNDRFRILGGEEFFAASDQTLLVTTLSEYGRNVIGLAEVNVIDKDAQGTKLFQLDQVRRSLKEAMDENIASVNESPLFKQVGANDDLFTLFSFLVVAEISNAIKGRGLIEDEKRYVNSETPLSRLHGVLKPAERAIVYSCFRKYHTAIFEEYEMLDSDDVALSLAGRLRTPVWQLRRKKDGFDLIFVDEAQLFNENERRVFPYLANAKMGHVPIALALDQAQDLFNFSSAGLATLGITDVENESLPSNHRSTNEIIDLAFFVIQQTTDLFSADFPDFKIIEKGMVKSDHPMASFPSIIRCNEEQTSFGRFVVKQVQKLRAGNVRQIAVVCHAEVYWPEMLDTFQASGLPLHIIEQRGEKISPDMPLVVLSRPTFIGGQEFDAVLSVGLEQGVTPPRIIDNIALAAAVDQQVLREIYLVVTRARYRYAVLLNRNALPNNILESAIEKKLLLRA